MKKPLLILALFASFITGTMVAGNFVFADPEDGQNSLLGQILQVLQVQVGPKFVQGVFLPQIVTCPDSSEPHQNYHPSNLFFFTGESFGPAGDFRVRDSEIGMQIRMNTNVGEITESDYTIQGAVTENDLCSGITIPSAATLSGNCGLGTTATMTTEEGFIATFNSDTVCG